MTTLVIDISAIPDTDMGAKLYQLSGLADEDVARVMYTKNREREQGEDLPLTLNRIISISCLLDDGETIKLMTLGSAKTSESVLLEELQKIITEEDVKQVVAWNGNRYEFPLLSLRCLSHTMKSALSETISCRDLNAELTTGRRGESATLHTVSVLCGLPGQQGMAPEDIWDQFLGGHFDDIQASSELNVIHCWLVHLNWCVLTGSFDRSMLTKKHALLKESLTLRNKLHLTEFVQNWNA